MKKFILPISALFVAGLFNAQTTNLSTTENYIYTKTYLDYDSNNQPTKISENVQYFDGLGRAKQVVNIKASPLQKDVVTKIEYDPFGRQTLDYLPVPQTGTQNGAIYDNPLANVLSSPYGSEKIYAEKGLENSPLDRILSQKQVGIAWDAKPIQFDYDANIDGEVKKYVATFDYTTFGASITVSASYGANQLYKNSITDEDGNKTIEFKNGEGQVILVRKMLNATESADTYYVYNEYNQLAYVLSPKAVDLIKNLSSGATIPETILNSLCYQYKYDGRNRLVEKRLPGKGKKYIVYDNQDRVIMTQDANLNTQGKWMITKYDIFGRPIYSGIISGGSRESMQSQAGSSSVVESRDTTGFSKSGMQIYYTNNLFYEIETVLSVNYYDTYPSYSFNPAFPTTILGAAVLTDISNTEGKSTKNLAVMNLVKNIEDDNWTKNYSYYDGRGRVIGMYSINYLGGYTQAESKLDFSGLVQQTITHHKRLSSDTERIITETFEYDVQNRLKVHKHKVDNNLQDEILAQNEYNELSQLTTKKVGGTDINTPLQTINYTYNIRGWMTQINDPTNLGTNNLFGYKINYNLVEGMENPHSDYLDLKVKPKFNGNIAEVSWKTATTPNDNLRRYGYVYDSLNRLQAGFYQKDTNPSAQEYFEKIDYDLNGNISHLKRSGALTENYVIANAFDDLTYHYQDNDNSNRLHTVTDASNNYGGYPEVQGTAIGYDFNGNMTSHEDKGVLEFKYNHLNLLEKIIFNSTYIIRNYATGEDEIRNVTVAHTYGADGTKRRKKYTYFFPKNSTERTTTTDYLDGFQYTINPSGTVSLDLVPTSEGYFDFKNNWYIYNYTDHLGNVRLSYRKDYLGNAYSVDENNYYPFGLRHEGYNNPGGNGAYQYKYNGKELQIESGMYDYGARMYMPDLGRWGAVDPLAETSRRWSPYNYAYNNPIRFVDPDGMQNEDVIKIFNNGDIKRTPDENPYDTVTNESGSESIKIAHINITKQNPKGDSQIGEMKPVHFELPASDGREGSASSTYSYLQIQNYDVATQFFEFAAEHTTVEFAQDTFNFTDGYSTSIIGTNHSVNQSVNAGQMLAPYAFGGHVLKDGTHTENVHSHPSIGDYAPSGFAALFPNGKPSYGINPFHGEGGDRGNPQTNGLTRYLYSPSLVKRVGGGYVQYDDKNAIYKGKTKK